MIERKLHRTSPLMHIAILLAVLAALALTSLYSYLLFHSLVEIFTVIVATSIFMVTWSARRSLQNGYLLFTGIAFLFLAVFDVLHLLAYKGMPVFPGYDADLPTQLWTASRYLLGVAFLGATLFLRRRIAFLTTSLAFLAATLIVIVSIFTRVFPHAYIEGVGLTPFKIYSEYIAAGLLAAGLVTLRQKAAAFEPSVLRWLTISLVLNILAGLAFTNYVGVFDFANLLGHLFKAAAYFYLYRAIVETSLYQPMDLLLRDLKESERSLRQSQAELEIRVTERTRQLASANANLLNEMGERNKAEEALRKSEALFRTVFERASLGIIVVGLDGIIQSANLGMEIFLDQPRHEIVGRHVTEITYPEDIADTQALLSSLAAGARTAHEWEKRYIDRSGKPVWAQLSVTVVADDAGNPQFFISLIKDINEERRSSEELKEIQRRLLESREEERLRLARDLHDGPIQELIASTFLLKQLSDDLPPESQAGIHTVTDQIRKVHGSLRAITGDLRPQTLTPFGFEKAVRSHIESVTEGNKDIRVELDLMPDGQAFPEATRIALFRVYRQAVDNIIQHANASRIRVSFGFDDEHIRLELEDNGQGFSPPVSWIQLVRGGHFGLAGMAERVEALNGRFTIDSAPGAGTTLRVEIPRQRQAAIESRPLAVNSSQ